MRRFVVLGLLVFSFCLQAVAQFAPRIEDHFWRRKVVNRIDLNEKINAPLIKRESAFYTENQNSETEGLVMALFHGLKAGKFVAFHPDSLKKSLSYDDVLKRIQEFEGSLDGPGDFDTEDEAGDGSFEDFEGDGDEWGFDEGDEFGVGEGDDFDDLGDDGFLGGGGFMGDFDPGPFENVIHFVEDRIFDKNRSDMVYDIQFVEIIWTDPGETLPEKKLCTFAYKDILETLDDSQWKNRFNDAEYKTLREVFELRLFHSYIINVSGEGLRSLQEAEHRRQKLIEFEHHLWSF